MVNALRALAALRSALDEKGLVRDSGYNGGETRGWLPSNVMGSTGFSLRGIGNGEVEWHLVVSGKRHMQYREFTDCQDDETYELHEPVNPEVLHPKLKAILAAMGVEVSSIKATDWSNMWDDDVGYTIRSKVPSWLEKPDPNNRWRLPEQPILVTLKADQNSNSPVRGKSLIGYVHVGKLWLTRETIQHLIDTLPQKVPSRPTHSFGIRNATSEFDEPEKLLSRLSSTVTNHWGDEIQIYPVFDSSLKIDPSFKSTIPFVMAGELRTGASFAEIDAQFGDETPWKVEPPPSPRP